MTIKITLTKDGKYERVAEMFVERQFDDVLTQRNQTNCVYQALHYVNNTLSRAGHLSITTRDGPSTQIPTSILPTSIRLHSTMQTSQLVPFCPSVCLSHSHSVLSY